MSDIKNEIKRAGFEDAAASIILMRSESIAADFRNIITTYLSTTNNSAQDDHVVMLRSAIAIFIDNLKSEITIYQESTQGSKDLLIVWMKMVDKLNTSVDCEKHEGIKLTFKHMKIQVQKLAQDIR